MRHKRKDRPTKKNIAMPTSIVERVEEQLADPLTNRPRFGAWSALVSALLVAWLNGEIKVATPLMKVRPFCHKCLLDRELYHTCRNTECPQRNANDPNTISKGEDGFAESSLGRASDPLV